MGRPLTGSIRRTQTGYTASLPAAPGSTHRLSFRFTDEADARAWCDAAVAARRAGRPVPPPPPGRGVPARRRPAAAAAPTAGPTAGPALPSAPGAATAELSFRQAARRWHEETYTRGGHAGADRAEEVRRVLNRLAGYFEDRDLTPGTLAREDYVAILEQWAGRRTGPLNKRTPRGADGPVRGYAGDLVGQYRGLLDAVLTYAWAVGGQPQRFAPESYRTPRTTAPRCAPPRAITLVETAAVAAGLHPVNQLVLWLLRVLGLRISEAFGLHVADVHPVPDRSGRGLLVIARQGGRGFRIYDENREIRTVPEVDRTKTPQSLRLVPVPAALMRLLELVIFTFHTGPDGLVDPDARLIPDLTGKGAGQGAFRAALGQAARRARVDVSSALADKHCALIPHHLRKALITDIADGDLPKWVRERYVGHRAGTDVHHGVYLLDDPAARPLLAVADRLQQDLDAALPDGLAIATAKRCTTGNQPGLAPRAVQIEAAMLAAGWLRPPTAGAEPLLDSVVVAELLAVAPTTARRYLADGTLPSSQLPGGRSNQRGALLSDVDALRRALADRTTMADLAEQLGHSVGSLHGAARRRGLPLQLDGNITIVPEQTRAALTAWAVRHQQLRQTACTHAQAARELGISARAVQHLVDAGTLVHAEPDDQHSGWLTRASVDQARAQRPTRRRDRRTTSRPRAEPAP